MGRKSGCVSVNVDMNIPLQICESGFVGVETLCGGFTWISYGTL